MKLLVLSIGRDIAASVERLVGQKADAVVQKGEVGVDDFPELRKVVYAHLKVWTGEEVRLVLSGPLALAFTLGQLVGLNHFRVSVLHYDAESGAYTEVAVPTRQEIS